ncbi:MAG: hypothetical protein E6J90_05675 [Deltaproteobacteria bacterium]|nr:MAG: hypothetical protein E6J90_05675 [Deltaproteobacteria bacterium]
MVVLAGCGDDLVVGDRPETPPIGDARATVTGSIVDANGAAVPGAMVMTRATDEQATAGRRCCRSSRCRAMEPRY